MNSATTWDDYLKVITLTIPFPPYKNSGKWGWEVKHYKSSSGIYLLEQF